MPQENDFTQDKELRQVVQTAAKNEVTSLNLSHRGLQALPAEIGQLIKLKRLGLSHNQLRTLPTEIARLTHLDYLDLSHNQLQALPLEITQLIHLIWLKLNNNQLRTLPSEISQMTNLRWLDLDHNQLQVLPPEIAQLKKLAGLNSRNNQLRTLPPAISQMINLQRLELSNNQLPNQISLPPGLKTLTDIYESWGGILQYAFYVFPSNNPVLDMDTSLVEEWSRLAIGQEFASTDRDKEKLSSHLPQGKRLSVDDFLGNCRFDMFEAEAQGKDGRRMGGVIAGYEFAFTQPPYGLAAPTTVKIFELFDQINALSLGPVTNANLIVYEWDTTWSNYFINDWWDFLWTAWSHTHKHLVLIYGSTTD